MGNRGKGPGKRISSSPTSKERTLLRKLADNYYSAFLVRVIEGIIHNLNGPLQILYIRSEQLEQGLRQLRDPVQSGDLTAIEGLTGRMEERAKSISKSLDDLNSQLMRIRSDLIIERRSEVEDVKLNQVIEESLLLLNADMFFKHEVKKTFRLEDAVPVIKGRKTDFRVIVLSLIQNAIEAMVEAQDKNLTVETSSRDGKVIVRIQDTGRGIPEQDRERIFDVSFTTKKRAGNENKLGLGLSLASLLLEDYNGTITCERVSGMTTFYMEIPCEVK